MKSIYALFFLLFYCISGKSGNLINIDSIFEYNYRRFENILKFNEANWKYGHPEKNIYTFIFDFEIGSSDCGLIYDTKIYKQDYFINLKDDIKEISDSISVYNNSNDSVEIYSFIIYTPSLVWLSKVNDFKTVNNIFRYFNSHITIDTLDKKYQEQLAIYRAKLDTFKQRMRNTLANDLYGEIVFTKNRRTRILISQEIFQIVKKNYPHDSPLAYQIIFDWTSNDNNFISRWGNTIAINIRNNRINYRAETEACLEPKVLTFEIIRSLRLGAISDFIPDSIKIPSFKETFPLSQSESYQIYDSLANVFAAKITNAYINHPVRYEYPDRDFNHLSNLDFSTAYEDQVLNDQLAYLLDKSGIYFVVMKGAVPIQIPRNLWNSFASHVLSKINKSEVDPPNGIVILTVPTAQYYGMEMQMPGLACTSGTIDLQSLAQFVDRVIYVRDYIRLLFKYCRKNVDIYTGYLYADGTRSFEKKDLNMSEGIGHPYNRIVYLMKNIYYDTIANINVPKKELNYGSSGIGYGIGEWYQNPDYEAQMVEYRYKVSDVLTKARNSISNASSWDTIRNIKQLIEPFIDDIINDYVYNYAFTEGGFSKFCQNVGILLKSDAQQEILEGKQSLQSKHTYDNEALSVIDPIVYATIDIAGLIPGVDNIADVAGLLYASERGDVDNVISYTAGFAVVGAGAIAAKCAKSLYVSVKGRKFFKNASGMVEEVLTKNVAEKSVATEVLGLEAKYMDDIGQDLISGLRKQKYHSNQISHFREITSEADRKKLLSAINKEKGDIYASIRNGKYPKIESVADFVVVHEKRLSLSTILKNMDEATLAKLEKDLAGEGGGVLGEYFRGSPGCVKAWEVAVKHSDDIRKNTDFLNYLSDYLDEFPYLGEDLADGVVFSAYKDFYPDIRQSFEVLDDVAHDVIDEVIEKTKNSKSKEFWKWIHLGRKFEKEFLLPRLKNRFSDEYTQLKNKASEIFEVNLDQYDMYSQVQLKFGDEEKYFVADQVYVKWGKADDGLTDEIKDIVIIEDKLSE
ncbi:MAG: hypothetical protein J5I59_06800, partial [Saprospiraceae bacterium]|nr:hypothetical protein [Saprospiraceae bacterium]